MSRIALAAHLSSKAVNVEECQRQCNLRQHNSLGMTSYQASCSGFWSPIAIPPLPMAKKEICRRSWSFLRRR
ncbi:hypothetical protein [Reticulibacter mediterranei]|uniref:hypothetical protein n=1 Tax=Reticulibacter mediterranei TaxID=2778369 RepID=UPI001C6940D7|nr:hypothetical protein [Reticulibacter mediterranei]